MTGSAKNGPLHAASGDQVPEWRRMIDQMRKTHPSQFLRVSRKMLNYLCSVGLTWAQKMLAEVEGPSGPGGPAATWGGNVPGARVKLENSPLMTGAPFELAVEFLGDEEITERMHK